MKRFPEDTEGHEEPAGSSVKKQKRNQRNQELDSLYSSGRLMVLFISLVEGPGGGWRERPTPTLTSWISSQEGAELWRPGDLLSGAS